MQFEKFGHFVLAFLSPEADVKLARGLVLLHPFQQLFRVAGRVVLYHFFRVTTVDCVYVFLQYRTLFTANFLNSLQATGSHEQPSCLWVVWKNL